MSIVSTVKKVFFDANTGVDGATFDAARIMLNSGCGVMLSGGAASIYRGTFDFVAFGAGFGSLLIGAGASIWMKRQTEPSQKITSVVQDGNDVEVTETKT